MLSRLGATGLRLRLCVRFNVQGLKLRGGIAIANVWNWILKLFYVRDGRAVDTCYAKMSLKEDINKNKTRFGKRHNGSEGPRVVSRWKCASSFQQCGNYCDSV